MNVTWKESADTDQAGRVAKLEAELARSRREIVTLTKLVLEVESAPRSATAQEREKEAVVAVDVTTQMAVFKVMAMSLHLTRVPFITRFGFFKRRHERRLANALHAHQLFDAKWYCETYPEAATSGMRPILYFITKGIDAGHAPHPKFSRSGTS